MLTTDGGTWEGTYTGSWTSYTSDDIVYWYTGKGAYTGWSMRLWVNESSTGKFWALIFPGEIPPHD